MKGQLSLGMELAVVWILRLDQLEYTLSLPHEMLAPIWKGDTSDSE